MPPQKALHALALSCAALLPMCAALAAPTVADPKTLPADALKWEQLTAKKSQELPEKPGSIVCIGSSHMAKWTSFAKDLEPLTVYNFGIGGSRMQHAAELFIPRLAIPAKPRAVILYEGSNDLAGGLKPAQVLKQFRAVYTKLHEALPETRLYVLGIVPSPGKRFERWEDIVATNLLLKLECAEQPWIRFIDTTTPLLGADGKPRPECFIPNDVHMTPEGYKVWADAIAPVLLEAEKAFETP